MSLCCSPLSVMFDPYQICLHPARKVCFVVKIIQLLKLICSHCLNLKKYNGITTPVLKFRIECRISPPNCVLHFVNHHPVFVNLPRGPGQGAVRVVSQIFCLCLYVNCNGYRSGGLCCCSAAESKHLEAATT